MNSYNNAKVQIKVWMRRTSNPQISTFFIRRQGQNKPKSPNPLKQKSRGKPSKQSTPSQSIMPRKVSSFSKTQINQSSTYFTQHNKTKKSFPETKVHQKQEKQEKEERRKKQLKKYEKQIMGVLNSSATVIQREWRKYLIRKYKKQIQQRGTRDKDKGRADFDQISGRTSQCSELYNHKKYYANNVNLNANGNGGSLYEESSVKKISQNSFNRNVFSFNLSESKAARIVLSPQKSQQDKKCKQNYKISSSKSPELRHNRTRSDQSIPTPYQNAPILTKMIKIDEKSEQKQRSLQIQAKIIDMVIEGTLKTSNNKNSNNGHTQQQSRQIRFEDHFIKNQKTGLDQILSKLENKLEQKKLKQLLALENSFSNNQMTFRSYKKNIQSVDQQHRKKLSLLQIKKKKFIAKLNKFVTLLENTEQMGEPDKIKCEHSLPGPISKNDKKQISMIEDQLLDVSFNEDVSGFYSRSLVLQDWEFQPSDKKVGGTDRDREDKGQSDKMDQMGEMGDRAEKDHKKKSQEILIYDNQRQNTIINQLTENEELGLDSKRDQWRLSQKSIKEEKSSKQIFNTPPKVVSPQPAQTQVPIARQTRAQYPHPCQAMQCYPPMHPRPTQQPHILPPTEPHPESQMPKPLSPQPHPTQKQHPCNPLPHPQANSHPPSHFQSPSHTKKSQRLKTEKQVQIQLQKFYPIKPNIDVVNNWLLEISHFILDNFGNQFFKKLVHIQQPAPLALWKYCINGHKQTQPPPQPQSSSGNAGCGQLLSVADLQYTTISQKIFKQFQFFHIKSLLTQQKVPAQKKQSYSALMYTFHQALYDCLNKILLDQLIQGRNWLHHPWKLCPFSIKKLIHSEHSKQCLQKAINRVSNISDYNVMPIDPFMQLGRQYEQTQHNLIFAEEIKEIQLVCQFQRARVVEDLGGWLWEQLLAEAVREMQGLNKG